MPNEKNIKAIEKIKEKLAQTESLILTEYHGLSANQMNELREKISDSEAELAISKNTLFKRALDKKTAEKLEPHLTGPTAVVYAQSDYVSPIKVLFEFAKNFELPKIKAGIIDGHLVTEQELKTLSELPTREVLIAQVAGGLKSPINGFVNVLGGANRKLVYALSAIAKSKQKEVS